MPTIPFRKRQRFSNIARMALTQGIVPSFHMGGLSGVFADAAVRFDRKYRRIGIPKIAETDAGTIGPWNPMPEPSTGAFTVIANNKRDDLARPTTQGRPQPAFPSSLADKGPHLVDFQDIIGTCTMERRPQRR